MTIGALPPPQLGASAPSVLEVLIAEDNDECLETLAAAVEALGHSCRTAHDGNEAWEIYQANGADVILSDWNMPGMTGLELCQKVRATESARDYTHFVFVTGNDEDAHYVRGMRTGADDYLAKPVHLDKLEARLEATRRIVMHQRGMIERNSRALEGPARQPSDKGSPKIVR